MRQSALGFCAAAVLIGLGFATNEILGFITQDPLETSQIRLRDLTVRCAGVATRGAVV